MNKEKPFDEEYGEKRQELDEELQKRMREFLFEFSGKTGFGGVEEAIAVSTMMICLRLDQLHEAVKSLESAVREK